VGGPVNGLEGVQVGIVMMRTPDGHGRLELTKFRNPKLVEIEPAIAPPNALRLRSVMFTVESVDDTVTRLRANGAELIGEVGTGKKHCVSANGVHLSINPSPLSPKLSSNIL
jgi:Glyoxalase/Bleomycin resistance protein/Dioxygenase superfamily